MLYVHTSSCCTTWQPNNNRRYSGIKTKLAVEEKPTVRFNINGGYIQIAPNATEQKQVFIGGKYAEEEELPQTMRKPEPFTAPAQPKPASPLSIYINNVEVLARYTSLLAACTTAKHIGCVVVDMVKDPDVKLDKYLMVKREFIERRQPLAPHVDNIRKYINDAWGKRKR